MTDLTEHGDVMINAYMDEWGKRKIDGLLEDGTKIIIIEVGVIDKSFSEVGAGSEVFGIPFKALPFTDAGQGVDAFNTSFRAMGFLDVGLGTDVFSLLRELGFSDVGFGSDVFQILFKAMQFSDVGGGIDVFALLRELNFSDLGSGADSFSKEILGMILKAFSDAGLGSDIFNIPFRAMKFQESGLGVDAWKGANLIEAPLVIVTVDGKIILRISRGTKEKPDYIMLG